MSVKYCCSRPAVAFSRAGVLQASRRPWFAGVVGSSEIGTEALKGWGHAFFSGECSKGTLDFGNCYQLV